MLKKNKISPNTYCRARDIRHSRRDLTTHSPQRTCLFLFWKRRMFSLYSFVHIHARLSLSFLSLSLLRYRKIWLFSFFQCFFGAIVWADDAMCFRGEQHKRVTHTHSPDLVLSGRRPTSSRLSPCNPKPIQITRAEVKKQNVRNTHTHTRSYGTRELIEKRNRNKF